MIELTLGTRIKLRRQRLNIPIAEVAAEIGYTIADYRALEASQKVLKYERIFKLAEILKVDPQYFMDATKEAGTIPLVDGNDVVINRVQYVRREQKGKGGVFAFTLEHPEKEVFGYELRKIIEARMAKCNDKPILMEQYDGKWYSAIDARIKHAATQ